MRLKQLMILRKDRWSDPKEGLYGTITFEDEKTKNEVKINIDEQASTEIVAMCAGSIIRASNDVATLMVVDVLHRPETLEHKPSENA